MTSNNKATPTVQQATTALGGVPQLILLPDGTELLIIEDHIGFETSDTDRNKGINQNATQLYKKFFGHIYKHIFGERFEPIIYGDAVHLTGQAVGYPG